MKSSAGPTGPRHMRYERRATRRKRKRPPGGGLFGYTGLPWISRSHYSGVFLPSLYVYRVVAAFFSSPFGSNAMLAVTPL